MKNNEAYEILDNYQFQDWNCLTDEYKQKLDDMKETCLKALRKGNTMKKHKIINIKFTDGEEIKNLICESYYRHENDLVLENVYNTGYKDGVFVELKIEFQEMTIKYSSIKYIKVAEIN